MKQKILQDQIRLEQIIINLASNSAKFTTAGSITLSCNLLPGSRMEISIRDTGMGLSEEDKARVFERFYQRNARVGSTGLGLNITRNLIELMNGMINVESALGVGSTFTVIVPVAFAAPSLVEGVNEVNAKAIVNLGIYFIGIYIVGVYLQKNFPSTTFCCLC